MDIVIFISYAYGINSSRVLSTRDEIPLLLIKLNI